MCAAMKGRLQDTAGALFRGKVAILPRITEEEVEPGSSSGSGSNAIFNGKATTTTAEKGVDSSDSPVPDAVFGGYGSGYFEEYASFKIHQSMLGDRVRTLTYRDAIVGNRHLFLGRVVLDVGCGTGILSMFAAQAGAKRVIAVDNSDIVHHAKQIVRDNGFESVVKVVKSRMEDLKELPGGVKQVDIIISEWMGYCLLNESMLDTVLFARDKWLAPGGLLFPDRASLYICGIEDRFHKDQYINSYKNVHGFDMSLISRSKFHRCHCTGVGERMVATNRCLLIELDLKKIPNSDNNFAFTRDFHLTCIRDDYISGFATFFTVDFSSCKEKTWLSTAPEAPYTHWAQTVFYLKNEATVTKGDSITGTFSMSPCKWNRRGLDVTVKADIEGELDSIHEENWYSQMG